MALDFLQSNITVAICQRILTSYFTKCLYAIKSKSFTKRREVISRQNSVTFLNTPLIYIRKRIGNTGKL